MQTHKDTRSRRCVPGGAAHQVHATHAHTRTCSRRLRIENLLLLPLLLRGRLDLQQQVSSREAMLLGLRRQQQHATDTMGGGERFDGSSNRSIAK
jgi:hypothetical protein